MASGRLAGAAPVCGHRAGRGHAESVHDFADAADESGGASGSVRLALGLLADRGLIQGERAPDLLGPELVWRPVETTPANSRTK
jgi:hypothetical protein